LFSGDDQIYNNNNLGPWLASAKKHTLMWKARILFGLLSVHHARESFNTKSRSKETNDNKTGGSSKL